MTSELSVGNLPPASNTASTTTEETAPNELGQDAFLQLLMTQIQNQNPLDPSDPSEFLGQLASFSSLEQMSAISEGIESLASLQATGLTLQNVDLVGKRVVYEGTQSPVVDGQAEFRLRTTTAASQIIIEYNDGGVTKTKELNNTQQGVHDVTLDELTGTSVEIISVAAYNGDSQIDTTITTHAVAHVDGLTFEGGTPKLMLGSTTRIDPSEVLEILE